MFTHSTSKVISLLATMSFLAQGCDRRVSNSETQQQQQQQRITALENKVVALETQQPGTPTRTPNEDGAARLTKLLNDFPPTLEGLNAKWKVLAFDIKKTDSLVSPLLASISVDSKERSGSNTRYRVHLAYQNETWKITNMESWTYLKEQEPNQELDPIIEDSSSPHWEGLQKYLK